MALMKIIQMLNKKKQMVKINRREIVVVSFIIVLVLISFFYNQGIKKEIEMNGIPTLAKITKVKIGGKIKCSIEYSFKYNGKVYTNNKSIECKNKNKYYNKYYMIVFSPNNLNNSYIDLEKEVVDEDVIKNW